MSKIKMPADDQRVDGCVCGCLLIFFLIALAGLAWGATCIGSSAQVCLIALALI